MAIHKVSVLKKVRGYLFRKSCKSGLKTLPHLFKVLSILNKVKGSYWQLGIDFFIWKLQNHLFILFPSPVCFENHKWLWKMQILSSLKHLNSCQHANIRPNILNWQQPAGAAGQWSLLVHLLPIYCSSHQLSYVSYQSTFLMFAIRVWIHDPWYRDWRRITKASGSPSAGLWFIRLPNTALWTGLSSTVS